MNTRHIYQTRKPEHKLIDNVHAHQNNQQDQKENNLQNLNLVKKSLKLNDIDPHVNLKLQRKNYLTNADNKINISLNYNSNNLLGEPRARINSRIDLKKQVSKKQKTQSNSEQYFELYGKDILLEHQVLPIHKQDFLKNHQIDAALRARMLDWMVQVTKSYKFINKSYFASVQLLDRYFTLVSQSVPVSQLHILGVTSMYVASKMQEIYPLKIKTIYEKIVHKKISKQALMNTEQQFFAALDHKVNSWTFFDLALLKVTAQIGGSQQEVKDKVQQVMSLISKFILYDYQLYIKYDMETFAKVLSRIAIKICNLSSKNEVYPVSCHEEVANCFKNFKTNFKGLNNIFKFADQKILQLVEDYFSNESKNDKQFK